MKTTILGSGYVGLVTAVGLSEYGNDVTCADVDSEKIRHLLIGKCPIFEPDLPELLLKNKIRFTIDCVDACVDAEIVIIAVGTPEKPNGSADLKYVFSALDMIIASGNEKCVVIVKSTVPVGTNDKLEDYAKRVGSQFEFVSNPEFLSQGTAVRDMLFPSRIVIGTGNEWAKQKCAELYRNFNTKFIYTDRRSAEMIKYAANSFLALKISYINEIANLCEYAGADIEQVALGIGSDERIGAKFLHAGIGYGGSCFPKDTKALHWLGSVNDCELKTVKAAIEVNARQKLRLLKKAHDFYSSLEGLNVAILGLAFKPGTNDLREAPSLEHIPYLLEEGATIRAWDYCAVDNCRMIYPNEIMYCSTIEETLKDADICFIFTEWRQICELELEKFALMRKPVILDGRNCYNTSAMREYSYVYYSIGRKVEEVWK